MVMHVLIHITVTSVMWHQCSVVSSFHTQTHTHTYVRMHACTRAHTHTHTHTHTKYLLTFGNFWDITLDLSKSVQNQTCKYVRNSLYTSLKKQLLWNKKMSFCTLRVTAFCMSITKTCLLCVVSEWLYPSMRMNYTTVSCHCCWQIDFTCFNLSPSWKMIVSFSTVLVSVHLAISIFISLKYR